MTTKTLESLELALAQKSLQEYSAETLNGDVDSEKTAATERRLRQGIEAFKWITRPEETIRQAVYEGLIEFSRDFDGALEALYCGWLAPYERVQALTRQQILRGGELDSVAEFVACRDSVRDWIERHEWAKASKASLERRLQAEPC